MSDSTFHTIEWVCALFILLCIATPVALWAVRRYGEHQYNASRRIRDERLARYSMSPFKGAKDQWLK